MTVPDNQTNRVTTVLIARIPPDGIADFRAYEDAVLPLLPEFNGRLERRLRNQDGTVEMHIVSFASEADRQNYRNDPRRTAQASLLKKSSAMLESLPMTNVS
jgi:antibiotic biosynthesis monooxygenase (ABM) superfamily enzyme